jgi:hypothetical protein
MKECKAPKCHKKATRSFLLHPYCEKHYIGIIEYTIMMTDDYSNRFTDLIEKVWDKITNLMYGIMLIIDIKGYRKYKKNKKELM